MEAAAEAGAIPRRGLIYLAVLVFSWGTFWPAMQIAVAEIPIFSFRSICVVLGALGLYAIARGRGQSFHVPRNLWAPLALVSLLNVTGWFYFSALAVYLIPSGRASIIAYTMPIWTLLFAIPILKQRPTGAHWLALALGLGGVALLLGGDLGALREGVAGTLAMLAGAMSFGLGAVVLKRVSWPMPVMAMTAWQLAIGGIPLLVAAALVDLDDLRPVSAQAIAATLYTIVFSIICGMYAWFRLVDMVPPQIASLATLLVPVVAVLSSAALLGESVGWREIGALALVLAAMTRVLPMPRPGFLARRRGPGPG